MSEDYTIWQHGFIHGFVLKSYNPELHANVLGFYNGKNVEY